MRADMGTGVLGEIEEVTTRRTEAAWRCGCHAFAGGQSPSLQLRFRKRLSVDVLAAFLWTQQTGCGPSGALARGS